MGLRKLASKIASDIVVGFALVMIFHQGQAMAGIADDAGQTPFVKGPGQYHWLQVQLGGGFRSPDEPGPMGHHSIGLQVGHRYGHFGAFLGVDMDRSHHDEAPSGIVRYTQVGPGVDYLTSSGFLRSSLSAGVSFLNTGLKGHDVGKRGWFADVRPLSVRWVIGGNVLEFSPLTFELTQPLGDTSLTIFDQYVKLAYEW